MRRNWSLVNDFLLVLLYSISGYSFVERMMDGSKVAKYIKTSVSEILTNLGPLYLKEKNSHKSPVLV